MITYFCSIIHFGKIIIESLIEKQWMSDLKSIGVLKQTKLLLTLSYVPQKLYYTALPGLCIKHAKMSTIYYFIQKRFSNTQIHNLNDKNNKNLSLVIQAINSYLSGRSKEHKPLVPLNNGNN